MNELKAPVSEIFTSYQGEGIFAGEPQIFVRFAGCNLKCGYCDTPKNRVTGHGAWVEVKQIVGKILKLHKSHHSFPKTVSLTGGEPLLHAEFLAELMPKLKRRGFKTYLETNGTLPSNYKKIHKYTDIAAMDIKLPSACGMNYWDESGKFLRLAGKKAFVKVIADSKTKITEITKASQVTAAISTEIPFVIQPSTPVRGCPSAKPADIQLFRNAAKKKLKNVFVIPQLHKIWKVR